MDIKPVEVKAPAALLIRFQPTDTPGRISRATLASLAKHLGFKHESEVLHYALSKLASEVLPVYEADDGPLTASQIAAIRKAAGLASCGKVVSSLF